MERKVRIETDTMGEVEVPTDAYYGAQTERARRNFAVGGGMLPAVVIRALGQIKAAAAQANATLGVVDADIATSIEQAAREVAANRWDAQFVVDVFQTGSGTSSNMNANEVIANRACELRGAARGSKVVHPNDHVNAGQSSNDVFPSALQIGLGLALRGGLLPALARLGTALHALADRTFDDVKTGRTHLMDAMPIRQGQQFRGYAQQCDLGGQRISATLDGLGALPLGGTAVGTGVNAHPEFAPRVCAQLAIETGLDLRPTTAPFQAQACLDAVVHASAALRTFATAFSKIANDVRWMASGPLAGLAELSIPAVQPGSSIMPGKVNPVICESVLMLCTQVIANDVAVAMGNAQGQFELNTMMPLLARNAVESVTLLANGCDMFRERCIDGLEIVRDVAGDRVAKNPVLATALNAEIGYDAAAAIAKEAAATGRSVRDIAGERTDLDPAVLDELLDPRHLCGDRGERR